MLQTFLDVVRLEESLEWAAIVLAFHTCIQLAVSLRVVMQRRAIGETLAWLILVFVLPVVGSIIYLLLGELRLGVARGKRAQEISQAIRDRLSAFDRPGSKSIGTISAMTANNWLRPRTDCSASPRYLGMNWNSSMTGKRSFKESSKISTPPKQTVIWNFTFGITVAKRMKSSQPLNAQPSAASLVAFSSMRWGVVAF